MDAARARGVKVICVNQDMPGSESHRDACVLPTDLDEVGRSQIELLGSLIGYDGKFAILSATTDEKSRKEADGLLTKYPDLRGILAPASVSVEQPAKAVQARGVYPGGPNASGKGMVVTDLGIPNQMRGFLKGGIIEKVALWDPAREAYVAGHLAVGLANGPIKLGQGNTFTVPGVGDFTSGQTTSSSGVPAGLHEGKCGSV